MAGSLFERLTGGEEALRMDEAESIRRHLARLFTARQGSVQALPDYGLPDSNDTTLSRSDLIMRNCRAVRECICRYEPRLTEVEVKAVSSAEMPEAGSSGETQAFRIYARIRTATGETAPWQWTVLLGKRGK